MDKVTVNGEPVPETSGSTGVRWEDIPNRHAYCDRQIALLRERADKAEAKIAGYENAITWNTSCTSCATILDSCYAETVRRERAEAELKALGGRISTVIAQAVAVERERAERAESALSDALLRLAHGDAELHAVLLADAGYDGLPASGGQETEGSAP